jgi:flagellar biogenesis protein FliO
MGGYIANFTVYTMAMIGLICFAVFIYKKVMDGSIRKDNSKFLCVEETMSLTPRKTLHVVRAGNEKFLIASDVDRTTLISKLGNDVNDIKNISKRDFSETNNISQIIEKNSEPNEIINKKTQLDDLFQNAQAPQPEFSEVLNQLDIPVDEPKFVRNRPPRRKDRSVVTLDFEKSRQHGFSTMKEMAKKINEL